ncbi:ethyl tert-butyl ether degradation protein EthD [Burkholderia sp. L27(2015)]|uniref:ethyl tert-butyl ether degradation protein EthD n=1 Tax=Burkholderia sp. L27(2015) TaxID=1641858 RepID=UPI00131DA147|nr:ethyl tert-butyl ether degradation protein EthD [Burkholderia sp. L27(2015)]
MEVCLFITAMPRSAGASPALDNAGDILQALTALAPSMPGLKQLVLHTPVPGGANDPYLKDESAPRCAMQFYFDEIGALEATLVSGGALHALFHPQGDASSGMQHFASLNDTLLSQQVMAVRRFPVPHPRAQQSGQSDDTRCTYLVSYEGQADDFNAWLGHYVDHHPQLMAQFPGIRQIEIYTRVDYRSDLPAARSVAMQRNKVVFDSPDALNVALASPVRHAMRDDFKLFPPFTGENFHFPMVSRSWHAQASAT